MSYYAREGDRVRIIAGKLEGATAIVRKVYKGGQISVAIDHDSETTEMVAFWPRHPGTKHFHYVLAPDEFEIFGNVGGF